MAGEAEGDGSVPEVERVGMIEFADEGRLVGGGEPAVGIGRVDPQGGGLLLDPSGGASPEMMKGRMW